MKQSGVYEILNTSNGKRYVGSAVSLPRRWLEHRSLLRKGKHHSRILQRAWGKYGEQAFEFSPLLVCAKTDLIFYEQRAMDTLRPEYNIAPTAGNCLGVKHSAETRARMSAANKGKKLPPEVVEKIAAANIGKKRSSEFKTAQSARATGRTHSDETKAKLSAINSGKAIPAATKEKISEALKGVGKPPRSAEHSAKISAATKGKPKGPKSEETKAKMRAAAKLRDNSYLQNPEIRRKRSEALKAHNAKRRAEKGDTK